MVRADRKRKTNELLVKQSQKLLIDYFAKWRREYKEERKLDDRYALTMDRVATIKLDFYFQVWLKWYRGRKQVAAVLQAYEIRKSQSLIISTFHLWRFQFIKSRNDEVQLVKAETHLRDSILKKAYIGWRQYVQLKVILLAKNLTF